MLQSNILICRMVNRACIWPQNIFCEDLVTFSQTNSQLIDQINCYKSAIIVDFV